LLCNYCKNSAYIVKDCRKLNHNNEQKAKNGEDSSTSAVIKTISDIKNNTIFMVKNEIDKEIIRLKNNQIKINLEALTEKENMFLTGMNLNIIKLMAVKNKVPLKKNNNVSRY